MVLLTLTSQVLLAQPAFYQSLDTEGDNVWGTQVIETQNSFAIIGLETLTGFIGSTSWYLTNEYGELIDKIPLFEGHDMDIKPSDEGSYLYVDGVHYLTLTETTSDNEIDILICAFDDTLVDTFWCKTIGTIERDIPTRLLPASENHIMAFHSRTLSTSPLRIIVELIKLNEVGEIIWRTDIGIEDSYNTAFNHLALPNGDHLTFYAACEPDTDCQSWLVGYGLYATKVNSSGDQLWTQELRRGDFLRWHGTDPLLLDNGLIALNWIDDVVEVAPFDVRFQDMLLWIDQEGEIVNEYFFPRDRVRDIYSMTKAANGDIIGAGSINMADLELGSGGYVFRMSPEGELLWERFLADVRYPLDQHFFNDVIEAEDGGIVLTGMFQDSFPNINPSPNNPNVWLVKLDSTGCLEPGCGTFQVMGAVVSTEEAPVAATPELRMYPNPTATFAHLRWSDEAEVTYPLEVQVYDLAGRPVLARTFAASPSVVQCADWPAGYYVVQVRDRQGRQWVERLVVR